jgi:hypothetical protein
MFIFDFDYLNADWPGRLTLALVSQAKMIFATVACFTGKSAYRRPVIRRRRILHPDAKGLAGSFAFPGHTEVHRMLQFNGSRRGAISHAAAAKPAFIGIERNGRLAFFGVGNQHSRAAGIHAGVATFA